VVSYAVRERSHLPRLSSKDCRHSGSELRAAIKSLGTVIPLGQGSEIYGANEPAENVYAVLSGVVRTYKVLEDGRRQIGSFYSTDDIFGLEIGDAHDFSAEAVNNCTILVVKRSSLLSLASANNAIARQLWVLTAAELQQAHNHMMLLMKSAQERLAMFLLEMAKRSIAGSEIDLPMTRQDIADFLGLTIETVSRTLSQFSREAIIELPTSRHVFLRNLTALSRLSE
jgi:CRP/FNR family transcriptional regulator, nitrogen fixation regulation protein